MTAEPTHAALRAHNQRIAGMLADPECVGELLLVGLAMARSVDLDDPPWPKSGGMDLKVIAARVYGRHWLPDRIVGIYGAPGDTHPRKRIRSLFHADRRRYDPDAPDATGKLPRAYWSMTCDRPMIRRDGLCKRSATERVEVTDPASGLPSMLGACSQKACKEWLRDVMARNRAELQANPVRVPAANTGGVLERHLPEIDWWKTWRAVDPNWSPPPEGRAFERPTLTLLVGDEDPAPVYANVRPSLTVLEGGWR